MLRTHCLFTCSALVVTLAACATSGAAEGGSVADDGSISLVDPTGDDKGPGTYVYPTDPAYKPGAFDITKFEVQPKGDKVEFRLTLASRIEDPWDSKAWNGNGFSVQMAFIHIDTDRTEGSGMTEGLPGTNVRFAPAEAWDRVVLVSPQTQTRLISEVEQKAARFKQQIVIPKVTRVVGKSLVVVVDQQDLGGSPQRTWGYQVLMQSNEGYAGANELFTRKVNEFEGQHRFGGGTDYDNDPHVLDLLMAPAKGQTSEAEAQYQALSGYNKEANAPSPDDLALVPMVYVND